MLKLPLEPLLLISTMYILVNISFKILHRTMVRYRINSHTFTLKYLQMSAFSLYLNICSSKMTIPITSGWYLWNKSFIAKRNSLDGEYSGVLSADEIWPVSQRGCLPKEWLRSPTVSLSQLKSISSSRNHQSQLFWWTWDDTLPDHLYSQQFLCFFSPLELQCEIWAHLWQNLEPQKKVDQWHHISFSLWHK